MCVYIYIYIYVCVCVCVSVVIYKHCYTDKHTHTHTHTHKYVYALCLYTHIFICIKGYVFVYIYIYWQHFFIDTYLIEHDRLFLSTCSFVNPLRLPYLSYDIRRELVDKPFIISYFPSIFCPNINITTLWNTVVISWREKWHCNNNIKTLHNTTVQRLILIK